MFDISPLDDDDDDDDDAGAVRSSQPLSAPHLEMGDGEMGGEKRKGKDTQRRLL